MKYCVSVRQPFTVLGGADEIRIDYKDINVLYDRIDDCLGKTFNIRIPKVAQVNWVELAAFASKCDLKVCLEDLAMSAQCKDNKLKFYWGYEITSFYELQGLIKMGVSELLLGAPLYFDLKTVKLLTDLPIRLIANECFNSYIPREEGICGTYIRPEDIEVYEKYVDTIEFKTNGDLQKEATLFSIYRNKVWNGNLNLILTNFNYNIDNRAIIKEFGEARSQCRHSCMRGSPCRLCYTAMNFGTMVDKNKNRLKK